LSDNIQTERVIMLLIIFSHNLDIPYIEIIIPIKFMWNFFDSVWKK